MTTNTEHSSLVKRLVKERDALREEMREVKFFGYNNMSNKIDELERERDALREALKRIDVLAEAGRRLDQGIMACDDIRAKVRAALEAKP